MRQPDSEVRHSAICQMILARLRTFLREPAAIFWVYVFPLLTMLALGVAFRTQPFEQITVVIQQTDQAAAILETLQQDDRFRIRIENANDANDSLRFGRADVIVAVEATGEPRYRYAYDPTRPGSLLARNSVNDVLQRAAGRDDVVLSSNQEITAPGSRYIDFLIPGLIGMGIMSGGVWGIGFAIVDMRIRKLLKRLLATPMKRGQFLTAIMISRQIFTIPQILLLLVCSNLIFGVVNQGSYLALLLLILLGCVQFSGIGLLIAIRAKTMETMSGLMNLATLPMWMVSGIFFSRERFPEATQPLIQLLPLTPLIDAIRGTMLEGRSLVDLSTELTLIGCWAILSFVVALRFFRWN